MSARLIFVGSFFMMALPFMGLFLGASEASGVIEQDFRFTLISLDCP
jgi:hypothetical protein